MEDDLPILQRRPLPNQIKSPRKKLIKRETENKEFVYNDDDESDNEHFIFDGPYYIKVGPSPFPWRKPKQLPKLIREKDEHCDGGFIITTGAADLDLDQMNTKYTDFDYYIYESQKKDDSTENVPHPEATLHHQYLNANNSVPDFVPLKPWRIAQLEKQLKDLSKHSSEKYRDKFEQSAKKCFSIQGVIGKKELKAESELEKKRKRNRERNNMEKNDCDSPELCSFKVSESLVTLSDEQLHSLALLKNENNAMSHEENEDDFYINEDGELIISSVLNKLNLKGFFLETLPFIPHSSFVTLTWVNLSFNSFHNVPSQLFLLKNIVSLNMRNNPISEIPKDIKKLPKLRYINFSFCLLSEIHESVFTLADLEVLDLSFNLLTQLHSNICNLSSLVELSIEGNMLTGFPMSIMKLNLMSLHCKTNFIHKYFWLETSPPVPCTLVDSALSVLIKNNELEKVPEKLRKTISDAGCANCGQYFPGNGIPVLKPVMEIFGVKHLPLFFHVCSQTCRVELQLCKELPCFLNGDKIDMLV